MHPLENYFKLIESNYLNIIREEFNDFNLFYNSFAPTLLDSKDLVWEEAEQAYLLKDIKTDKIEMSFTFKRHLNDFLSEYEREFKNAVRRYYINNPNNNIENWCKILQKEISILVNKSKNIKKSELIKKSLESLDLFLSQYTSGTFISYKTDNTNLKLKWQGNLNTLVTLFFDLTNQNNKLQTTYIPFERRTISKFIANNFVGKDGNIIKEDTVYRILDPSPHDTKKAQDRLTLTDKI